MEIGGLRGLTFDTGQDKLIQDLQYQDQMMQRKRMQDAALAQQLVGDIEFLKGSNKYDADILQKEGISLLTELGQMTAQRGKGWESDPVFRGQLQYKKAQLGNSKAAIRSAAYLNATEQYQKYMAEAAKDPKMYDMQKLAEFKSQLDNYGKDENGNFLPSDKVEPIQFSPPSKFIDKDAYFADIAKGLPMKSHRKVAGGFEEYVSDDVILEQAKQIASSRPRQWEVEYTQNGIDPVQGIAAALKARAPYKFQRDEPSDFPDWKRKQDYLQKLKQQESANQAPPNPENPYRTSVVEMDEFPVDDEELIAATFGPKPKYSFRGPDGTEQSSQGDRFYYTWVRNRKPQQGDPPFKKGSIKEAEGFIVRPLSWGIQNGVVEKPWFSKEKYALDPDAKKNGGYELFYPEGEEEPVIKIRARTNPIKADDISLEWKYNSLVKGTAAQRNKASGYSANSDFQIGKDEAGNVWKVYSDGRQELMK